MNRYKHTWYACIFTYYVGLHYVCAWYVHMSVVCLYMVYNTNHTYTHTTNIDMAIVSLNTKFNHKQTYMYKHTYHVQSTAHYKNILKLCETTSISSRLKQRLC